MQKPVYPKVAADLLWIQFLWALGFLGVMLAVHIIKMILTIVQGSEMNDFFAATLIASNIFMLVIGIISIHGFLPFYVSQGVTRKDYFKGAALSALGLSIVLPVIMSIVTLLERWIVNFMIGVTFEDSSFARKAMEAEDNLIADVIKSIIVAPVVDLQSNWFVAILIFAINLLTYFIAGWFIGTAFYRFGVMIGLAGILIAIFTLYVTDLLLSVALQLPVSELFATLDLPLTISVLGVLALLAILLWMIRQMTKRVTVKI